MIIDHRYLYAIAILVWSHMFAAISTYHAVLTHGAVEGNPLVSYVIASIGAGPALILMYIIGVALIASLPFVYNEHTKFKVNATTISYSVIFILLSADSIHDFLALIGHPAAKTTYAILHGFLMASPYIILAGIVVIILYYSQKRFLGVQA